jgi:hypothetical protein
MPKAVMQRCGRQLLSFVPSGANDAEALGTRGHSYETGVNCSFSASRSLDQVPPQPLVSPIFVRAALGDGVPAGNDVC